jgi:predicted permease
MQDLRDALRALRASPVVSAVLILSLALGIGANTALFSILNAIILKPLPVEDPDSLVRISGGADRTTFTKAVWEQIRHQRLFAGTLAWLSARFDLSRGGPTEFVDGMWASGNAFAILGVQPALGRLIGEDDDRAGGGPDGPVVVISHRLWRQRFAGAPDVIGRTLTLDRVAFRIVGVTAASFTGLDVGLPFDVAVPISAMALTGRVDPKSDGRTGPWLNVMARLQPGDAIASAGTRLRAAQAEIREATLPDYPRQEYRDAFLREPFEVVPLRASSSFLKRRYERPLKALLLVVALVLVIACANIANLLLARTAARRHELGVKRALGASRLRLARQLAIESLLLAVIGTALGALVAAWTSRALVLQLSTWSYAVFLDLSPDARALGVTAGIAAAAALLFGTVPALRAASVDPVEALRSARTTAYGAARIGLAGALVVGQIAISLVLVAAAGLFARSFRTLATLDVGFDRDAVLVADADVRKTTVPEDGRAAFAHRIRDAAAAAPGVRAASVSVVLPAGMMKGTRNIRIPGARRNSEAVTVQTNEMTPGWFETLGLRLVTGRDFTDADRAGAPAVAVVNEAFVRRYLRSRPALAAVIEDTTVPEKPRSVEIVGVVADAIYYSIREQAPPTLYQPLAQSPWRMFYTFNLCVRGASGVSTNLQRAVAEAVARVDPNVSLTFRPLRDQIDGTFAQERLLALVSGFFGALSLLLASLGLYGVTAHAVTRRRGEIGIRAALGAAPAAVTRMILRSVAGLVGLGISIGLLASLGLGRLAASLLFGIEPRDPATLGGAGALLALVAMLAGWLPSRRAARIDPMTVLKES